MKKSGVAASASRARSRSGGRPRSRRATAAAGGQVPADQTGAADDRIDARIDDAADRGGNPVAADRGRDPAAADRGGHPVAADRLAGRGAGILALLGVAWLAATLWSAHATVIGSADAAVLALTQAALSLPSVITASLLAGGAVGLVAIDLLGRRIPAVTARPLGRYGCGLAGGLTVGLVGGALILVGYGTTDPILVLAAALATASLLGGTLAGIRPTPMVAAGFAGLLAWFGVGLLQGLFSRQLLSLFGSGDTVASRQNASALLALAIALAGGVVAGAAGYAYLRRTGVELRWPAYLAAGGGPGLLLLLADLVTLVGGAQLLGLVGSVSQADRAVIAYLSQSRLETGLVVFFVGALTAILAFGRTLRSAPAPEDADA